MAKYDYFDHDNALYRRPAGTYCVTEVKSRRTGLWLPYEGNDVIKPIFFGDQITPEEAGETE